jgi:tripartite-type tricarboxylate transporter receptor subunit TctC
LIDLLAVNKNNQGDLMFASSLVAGLAALGLLTSIVPGASAQTYPNRPINIVIPLAAGDAGDLAGRAMGDVLGRTLKTTVVAINRPGASGVIATDSVVKAPRDGYTLLFTPNPSLTYRPVMEPQTVPYDPIKDLTPLAITSRSPLMLTVRAEAPFRTLKDLVEFAKARPVRLGTPGVASAAEFAIHLINSLTGAGFTPVPFNGATPAVTALRGEHVDGVVSTVGSLSSHIKSGVLRGLMISDKFPDLPAVPTMQELGFPQGMFSVWFAFFAPADVPADVVKILVPAIRSTAESKEVVERLALLGIVQSYTAPERLTDTIREEHQALKALAIKAGLIK